MHLAEPHGLWTSLAPAAWRGRVPQVKMIDDVTKGCCDVKFASVHASLHNHFRHLIDRKIRKERRSAVPVECQNLAA